MAAYSTEGPIVSLDPEVNRADGTLVGGSAFRDGKVVPALVARDRYHTGEMRLSASRGKVPWCWMSMLGPSSMRPMASIVPLHVSLYNATRWVEWDAYDHGKGETVPFVGYDFQTEGARPAEESPAVKDACEVLEGVKWRNYWSRNFFKPQEGFVERSAALSALEADKRVLYDRQIAMLDFAKRHTAVMADPRLRAYPVMYDSPIAFPGRLSGNFSMSLPFMLDLSGERHHNYTRTFCDAGPEIHYWALGFMFYAPMLRKKAQCHIKGAFEWWCDFGTYAILKSFKVSLAFRFFAMYPFSGLRNWFEAGEMGLSQIGVSETVTRSVGGAEEFSVLGNLSYSGVGDYPILALPEIRLSPPTFGELVGACSLYDGLYGGSGDDAYSYIFGIPLNAEVGSFKPYVAGRFSYAVAGIGPATSKIV